jgi:putative tryptophan/tyrosine transport system substrate-binding protein
VHRKSETVKLHTAIILVAGAVTIWPLRVNAQQPTLPIIGVLNSTSVGLRDEQAVAFHAGLKQAGYVDKQNVTIEYRWADNQYDRLPGLAAELVKRGVSVIVASGGPTSAIAAKKVTTTVPIVFTTVADPIGYGLVASLNRPGGNLTGNAGLTSELDPKRLELLHQIKPSSGPIGVLINPNRPDGAMQMREVHAGAKAVGRELLILGTSNDREIDAAFETLSQKKVDALLVTADAFFSSKRSQLIGLAARHAIPTAYQWREFTTAGGLMSYGPSVAEVYVQTGIFVGRILKGAQPADLPVMVPSRFELVINLKTAKALGLTVPRVLLSRADELVE